MIFNETTLPGGFIIEPELFEDERGFFARTWSYEEFAQHGLNPRVVETNLSFNKRRGTLRGMHFQVAPYAQAKLVHCPAGAIYDVIIDLRRDSPTFKRWTSAVLSAKNRQALYVPEGFAHGFLTLEDDTEVWYQMSEVYAPGSARGVRWNDPQFAIAWPADVLTLNERDRAYPDFQS